jgi:hypothetical protein
MRLSLGFAVSSAVAILSTALLSGSAVSQISTGTSPSLPSVTIDAPKQMARPHAQVARPLAPNPLANTRVSRQSSSTGSSTTQMPSAAPNSVRERITKLERAASSCNGGCETSFRVGNAPWVGCSWSGETYGVGAFSVSCTDTLSYKTYLACTDTKAFLGATQKEARWICSSLHAGGKLTQEKVAAFKPSGR